MSIDQIKIVKTILIGLIITGAITSCTLYRNDTDISVDDRFPVTLSHSRGQITRLIKKEFAKWQGTRHTMGGAGKYGFDCSGFTYYIFARLFQVGLPRTTNSQARIGQTIKRSQLKAGDLVFFKPASYPRHVGVYVGNNQFVHASTSKGIMASRIDSEYWARHYWMSRRVITPSREG